MTDDQRDELGRPVNTGRGSARKITRARVLLKAADGQANDAIAAALDVAVASVGRVRRRFAEAALDAAVEGRPQPPRPDQRRLDGDAEARLTKLACSPPPDGHDHWTPDLLAGRMVRLTHAAVVSQSTVRRHCKKASSSRGSPSTALRVRRSG